MFTRSKPAQALKSSKLEQRISTLDNLRLSEYVDSYLFELQSHWANWEKQRGTDSLASARLSAETLEVLLGALYKRLEGE